MTTPSKLSHRLQMLTLTEAASELHISIDALLDLCVAGKLTCFRLGRNGEVLRVIRRDLEACKLRLASVQEAPHV